MREPAPIDVSSVLWHLAGMSLVFGLALFCGRFVEEAARERHAAATLAAQPRAIMQLSAEPTELDLGFDGFIGPVTSCTPRLTLAPRDGAILAVTVEAPCAAGQAVEIAHADLVFSARMPVGRPLHLMLPALDARGRVTARLPGGGLASASAALTGLENLRRFAVAWDGATRLRLAPDHDAATGWLAELGDADLPQPRRAQVFTYPATGPASVTLNLASDEQTCGQKLVGRTISSRSGQAEATALTVDLPDCLAGTLVMHLKNLDREMKLAAR